MMYVIETERILITRMKEYERSQIFKDNISLFEKHCNAYGGSKILDGVDASGLNET